MSAFSKETLHMKTITALIAGLLLSLMATAVLANDNFRTHCQGGNEVPPIDTDGQCQAIFNLIEDGTGLQYKLIVANLEFVTQAHIHLAPAGANGGVVVFLFGFEPVSKSWIQRRSWSGKCNWYARTLQVPSPEVARRGTTRPQAG